MKYELGQRTSVAIFAAAGMMVAASFSPVHAQDTPDRSDSDEIIVTATGRAQSALSVPYNVTALSQQELREENITDIKRLITLSPSINAPQNGARFADSVTVRGLNVSPVNANNLEQFARSTLAYYLDDTPLPNIGYRIKDIARVETLLGPQGTLYGAGSLGGTVRFITNQPAFDKLSVKINASVFAAQGGALSQDSDAVINIPIASTLALRASVAQLDDGGYTDRISNPSWRSGALAWETKPNPAQNLYKNDDYNRVTTGRIALAWQVTPDFRVTIAHAGQRQLAHGTSATSLLPLPVANAASQAEIDAYIADPTVDDCTTPPCRFTETFSAPTLAGQDVVTARYPEFARRLFRLTSLDFDADLGFARLHSSTSYFKDTRRGEADYAGQGWLFYYSFGDAGGAFDSGRSAFITFDNTYKGINHETRLTSTNDGPFSWIAGIYYTDNKRSLKYSEILPGIDDYVGIDRTVSGGNLDEGYRENLASNYEEIALYGELGYEITPEWKINVGGRVFNYKDRAIAEIRDYSFDLVDNSVDATVKVNGKSYFKFNTSYNITPQMLVYATVSQGFRRGGTNGFRDVGGKTIAADTQSYKPDSTINYEIGAKGSFADGRVAFGVDGYQIDWKDVQTYLSQDISGFPVNGTANGPSARSRGFEATAQLTPVTGLKIGFSTAYTEAKWNGTKTQCLYTDGTGCRAPWIKGGLLGGSPKWKHSGDIRYASDLGTNVSGWASIAGRYVGRVQIDRNDDPTSDVRGYPSYALFDVRTGIEWRQFSVSLWVENIANKRSPVSQQNDRVLGARIFSTTPRTFGLNASVSF